MNNATRYLRDIEAAHRYGISRPTIWRWVKNGKFPKPIKLSTGSTRWRLSELEAWEQSHYQAEGN
ncbi:MAG: AlpA family transcriptional regulator [Chlamydiales bacterium]|nr:AlpA family transcriptional regulator [Chlamydiales bacterium]